MKKKKITTDPDGNVIVKKGKKVTCQCWMCKHVYTAKPGTDCPKCNAA